MSALKVFQCNDLPEMNDLDRHTERLCSSCLSISPAHAPHPEGAAHEPLLGGGGGASSEKYAITQLITSGNAWFHYCPGLRTLPKKDILPREAHELFYYAPGCEKGWGGGN